MTPTAAVLLTAFVLSVVLTLLAERVARLTGIVAQPVEDRWHHRTVPLLGGIPIALATVIPALALLHTERNVVVLGLTALAIGIVGLVDDVRRLSPQAKLLMEVLAATVLLYFGFVFRLTGNGLIDVFVTLFWIVGITNAFNLLDNMDGLSGTIAVIAGSLRLLFFAWEGHSAGVQLSALFVGAVAGFLLRNFPPAKIFMGDAGSLFLGFFLAGLCLATPSSPYSRGIVAVLVVPVLLLLIPIFDTAFVTATRLLSGRRVDVGGRDHTSHRLVAIGLTERQTVIFLAVLSSAAGGIAILSYQFGLSQTVVLLALLVIGLVLFGIHLSRVRVVHSVAERDRGAVLRLLGDFQYKRQVMTLVLDVCLIPIAYYAAYLIRFEDTVSLYLKQFYGSLPIVLLVQLGSLAAFGLYRGIWRFVSVPDLVRIVKATAAGTMGTVVVLLYTERFIGFSRTVFILDWILLVVLIGGSRASFRIFAEVFRPKPRTFRRVLIYGAGGGGELIVREMFNNPTLQRVPMGFVDDDRNKHATRIHGLPVFGDIGQMESLVREHRINEVVVSSSKIAGDGLARAVEVCARLEVPIRKASVKLE